MFESKGKGYIGQSMSVNASIAYKNDEMPKSKWSKKLIIGTIEELIQIEELEINFSMDLLKKLTLSDLREISLRYTSYHHTGTFYNSTDFYELDVNYLEKVEDEDIQEKIDNRIKHLEDTKEERKIANELKAQKAAVRKAEKEHKEEVESVLHLTKYKTLNGLLNAIKSGRVDLQELKNQKQVIDEEKAKRREETRITDPELIAANVFKTTAGQVRKETDYKNANEMWVAFKNGTLEQEVIDLMNERSRFTTFTKDKIVDGKYSYER